MGAFTVLDLVCRKCIIGLDETQFVADLIMLPMSEFDVILGMDWVSSYHVSLDCFDKVVSVRVADGSDIVVATSSGNPFAKAFLAHISETMLREQSDTLDQTRVVCEFQDVFQDIPGLPPRRDIEFCIELQPGVAPISRAPYRMAPAEMRELQVQLEELVGQGFIRRSHSP